MYIKSTDRQKQKERKKTKAVRDSFGIRSVHYAMNYLAYPTAPGEVCETFAKDQFIVA